MKKVAYVFNKVIILLTFLLTLTAFLGSLITIYSSEQHMLVSSSKRATKLTSVCIVLGCIVVITIFTFIFKFIDKLSDKKLKIASCIMFVIFAVASAFVVINFQPTPTTDSFAVESEAMAIASGEQNGIGEDGGIYFKAYTNNDFLTLLTALFFKICLSTGISNTILATILLSAFAVFLSQIFAYLAVRKLSGLKTACKYMALSTLQPILYLSIPWYYSLTICLPFMTSSLYFCICAYKAETNKKRILYGILFALVTVTGYYIRPVVMITAIACAICACMIFIIKKGLFKRFAAASLCCVIVFTGSFLAIKEIISHYRLTDVENDVYPITNWLVMGLSDNGTISHDDMNYTNSFKTKQEKIDANLKEIKKRILQKGVPGLLKLYCKKQIINWSDGSAAYAQRLRTNHKYGTVYRYIAGNRNDFLILYCQIYRAAVLLLAAVYLFKLLLKKDIGLVFMPILILFGGMLFYLLWEAKHCYSVPFIFLILILSALELIDITKRYKQKITPHNRTRVLAFRLCIIAAVAGIFFIRADKYTVNKIDTVDYSLVAEKTFNSIRYVNFSSLEQSFYSDNPFNTLCMRASKIENKSGGSYEIQLEDSAGNVLMNKKFSEKRIKSNKSPVKTIFNFKTVTPNGKTKYVIKIKSLNNNKTVGFHNGSYINASRYDGEFKCDDEIMGSDLAMNVYNFVKKTYMPLWLYIITAFCALAPYVFITAYEFLKKKKAVAIDSTAV